ncbi:MAG: hypothetical protein JW951_02100, partial [Lentisphaerae bacterium]|nr:hypothetical protein [Lentisphaerota bacterium]
MRHTAHIVAALSATVVTTMFVQAAAPTLRDHWAFDETIGMWAINSAGGTAGAISNGVTVGQTGKIGGAYDFDGNGDSLVLMTGDTGILGGAARTVSAWINTADANSDNSVISWGKNATGSGWDCVIYSGRARVQLNGGYRYTATTGLNNDTWRHVVWVLPGGAADNVTDTIMYIDGEAETVYTEVARTVDTVGELPVALGTGYARNTDEVGHYNGLLDDVAVWSDA